MRIPKIRPVEIRKDGKDFHLKRIYTPDKCAVCGVKPKELTLANQQGWSFQWIGKAKKRWTCGPCLWALRSGFRYTGIERIKK